VLVFIAGSTFAALAGATGALLFYIAPDLAAASGLLHHYGSLPPGNYPRVEGTYIYPAMLCNYLTVGMMLTLAAGKLGWIGKSLAAAIVALHVIAAIFTVTPGLGGFVFAGAAWIAYLLWQKRPGREFAAMAAGILLAAASVVVSALTFRQIPTSPYRLELWGTTIDPTQRLLTWQGSFATFAAHPLVGKGLGLPATAVEFLAPSGGRQMLTDAHNTFLNIAATTGVLGLAAVLLLCIMTIAAARRALGSNHSAADSAAPGDGRSPIPPPRSAGPKHISLAPLTAALLIAFISGFIIQGLTGSFEDARHLWLAIGLIFAMKSVRQPPPFSID
jgi:putative inorganic carbon (hco3(-)) transporter